MKDLLVVFPLKKERHHFCGFLEDQGLSMQKHNTGQGSLWSFPRIKIQCAIGGHGKTQFAITCQSLLKDPGAFRALVCAGAGGGLAATVNPLDVVVGTQTIEHDFKMRFGQAELPLFICDSRLQDLFQGKEQYPFVVHRGMIASGDEDIITAERAQALEQQTGALAVAWEGAGGARTALHNQLPYLEIRAITDNARSNVANDFAGNLPKAMHNLARVFFDSLQPAG